VNKKQRSINLSLIVFLGEKSSKEWMNIPFL